MYAYLLVSSEVCDVMEFHDGSTRVVDRSEGQVHARTWLEEEARRRMRQPEDRMRVTEALGVEARRRSASEQARRRYDEAHAEWSRRLDEELDNSLSILHGRQIRADFIRANPEPVLDRPEEPNPVDPTMPSVQFIVEVLGIQSPTVSTTACWLARLGTEDVSTASLATGGGYPRTALARRLTHLEEQGWTVVQVTEDRVAQHGTDGSSHTKTVGASILLHSAR